MSDLTGPDPTIYRRRLRSELRKAREAAGKTQRETAQAMDWSISKLIRIETGDVRVSINDLRAMLSFYGAEPAHIAALAEVARAARETARWARYRDVVSPEYLAFLGYESSATIIRNFEPILVPGLLQTEEYAREVVSQIGPAERIDSLIDLRIERQEILVREPAPHLHFIIDESVLRHLVGGSEVMRRQLVQLTELAARPHIHLRILTFDHGIYPRMHTPYVIFEFEGPEDEDVLYIENATGGLVIKENSAVDVDRDGPVEHLQSYWYLEQLAHREETLRILERAIDSLSVAHSSRGSADAYSSGAEKGFGSGEIKSVEDPRQAFLGGDFEFPTDTEGTRAHHRADAPGYLVRRRPVSELSWRPAATPVLFPWQPSGPRPAHENRRKHSQSPVIKDPELLSLWTSILDEDDEGPS